MQTFMTSSDPEPLVAIDQTFAMLDQARLGKQRVETYQILLAHEEHTKRSPAKYIHWMSSPAVHMWKGHLPALAVYGTLNCLRWRRQGHADTLLPQFQLRRRVYLANDPNAVVWPWWFGHPAMVRTHQTKLYHKGSPIWVAEQKAPVMQLPYLWPDPDEPDVFRIAKAEQKRGDWEIPSAWSYDAATRVVVPR